jgi:hypothetical protein
MHGGAKGSGAPKGEANGNYQHGSFTCEAIQERRLIQKVIRQAKSMLVQKVIRQAKSMLGRIDPC